MLKINPVTARPAVQVHAMTKVGYNGPRDERLDILLLDAAGQAARSYSCSGVLNRDCSSQSLPPSSKLQSRSQQGLRASLPAASAPACQLPARQPAT